MLLVGAGGIGSQLGLAGVKLGFGFLDICDPDDWVEPSNLNRQLLGKRDLYGPKAPALARWLQPLGALGTALRPHKLYLSEFRAHFPSYRPGLLAVGVDNNRARAEASTWCLELGVPMVSVGIARDASAAYVFIQEGGEGQPCLRCHLGDELDSVDSAPCGGTPAVIDVLLAICGFAAYGMTSLLLGRERTWNLLTIYMVTGQAHAVRVQRDPHCTGCSAALRSAG